MTAPENKTRTLSLAHRLLRLRQRFHTLRARYRSLQARHARSFQRRLDQLQREMTEQARRDGFPRPLSEHMEEVGRRAIELALEHSDGDLADAAMLLGVSLDELQALLQRHDLLVDEQNG